ncbi:MAG TPA: TRAP transporter small permease subunit [Paracoccaceae bacterium]|jgi:TRAP-type C4-dicarboxylate transport system permease small subunit|nr:TRAP transporter small permease subunit [Paracoccaceae bacterium]
MKRLTRYAEALASFQANLAGLAVLGILLTISLDVLMRSIFKAPFSATTEIVSYYWMVPAVFLPMMFLEISKGHIETDLFYQHFSVRLKKIARLIAGVLTIGIYGLLAWFTFEQALRATTRGEVAMGVNLLPIWPVRWIMPVVFTLATATALLVLVKRVFGDDPDA